MLLVAVDFDDGVVDVHEHVIIRIMLHEQWGAPLSVGTLNHFWARTQRPAFSASLIIGTRPAADTRFGSPKEADTPREYEKVASTRCLSESGDRTLSSTIYPDQTSILGLTRRQNLSPIGGSKLIDPAPASRLFSGFYEALRQEGVPLRPRSCGHCGDVTDLKSRRDGLVCCRSCYRTRQQAVCDGARIRSRWSAVSLTGPASAGSA